MHDALYIDIETIPAQRPDILAEIREACAEELQAALAAIAPPANYKDPAKIAEWDATVRPAKEAEARAAAEAKEDESYRRTALDGAFGQVCAVGYVFGDGIPEVIAGMDEAEVLGEVAHRLRSPKVNAFDCTVVGHNVVGFDLRFLTQRSIVRGIRPPAVLSRAAAAKPWEADKVYDTMVQWAGTGSRISLEKLCKALDIPSSKGDLDGSKVWDYVKAGRLQEVADYCRRDVEAVRQVHQRMTFARPR